LWKNYVKKYTPKYGKTVRRKTGKGLFRRGAAFVAGVLKRRPRSGPVRVKQPSVVVGSPQKNTVGDFSRLGMLCVLLALALGAGGWYARQLLDDSEIFRLSTVSVQGNRMTMKSEILDMGGIEQGISLLSFDVALAEERISRNPWIRSAEIVRAWPSSLTIAVHEYQPLAMVNIENETGHGLYYVNGQGKIFARVEKGQELDYPVVTGIDSMGKVTGTAVGEKGLAAEAFRFLRLAARGNPIVPLQTISEVNVNPVKGITVYLVDSPFPIYMGHEGIRTRYYQLVKLLERLYRKKEMKEIKEIRMDYYRDRILVAKVES
jgi:cell division protein FtsQ